MDAVVSSPCELVTTLSISAKAAFCSGVILFTLELIFEKKINQVERAERAERAEVTKADAAAATME